MQDRTINNALLALWRTGEARDHVEALMALRGVDAPRQVQYGQFSIENGQLPQACDFAGALRISIAPAVISALIFIAIVEVRNYSRWKLLGCLLVVLVILAGAELSNDILTQQTSIGDDFTAC